MAVSARAPTPLFTAGKPSPSCTEYLYAGFPSQVCVVVILRHVRPVPLALLGLGEEGPRPSWPGVLGSHPIV